MLKKTGLAALATALLTGTALANGPELLIEDFVGTIKIENSASGNISITQDKNMRGVNLVEQGSGLKIDGGISDPDGNKCKGYYGSYSLGLFKKEKSGEFGGYEDLEDYPQITISAPDNTMLIIQNTIAFVTAENLGETDLDLRYCGKLNLGDVAEDLRANIRGSADLTAKDVGDVFVDIRGSGDLNVNNAKFVSLSVAGSGDAEFDNVLGADVSVSGSGDISFGNIAGSFAAESRGSGDIDVENVAGDFIYDAGGSGDLDIGDIVGNRVSIDVSGSGDVDIDGGNIETLTITASGASEVDYGGQAETADLIATGASEIWVDKVTGDVRSKERGAADISVNR
ncbi:GIN domain-containing protein [Hellea balneolensis]|uniref:GIN domain-containing protein n=1 Tax=Hellea balneolensis TaxID=287478 RepID=UPI00041B3EAD|nr:DUF2807 domain-containing protein [Hellea balneolensis]